MAIIKCKMCGGDLKIEGSTVCECEYCGTKQTVPSADNEKKLTLFSRAGRLLRACEFDKAAGVFETIVADFPEEAEAYWGLVLCKYGIEYVDDPATGKKIPTCHRSSFESVLDDPNYEQACENTDALARRVYRDEARQIENLRKRIIEVSGKEEPYDVFISYKETDESGDRTLDSVIAQDIYTELTEKGYRVFFSRISLEDKLGTEYEPYIFAALNSAKVMIVVGTDYENFDSVWVKNEWSRFLKLIASGQKKTLIPVFKNMDAYDMPKEFAKLAAQDMGKVGAMQDLVRGVEKLIHKKPEHVKETVKETVVVQQGGDGLARINAALDRGFMALEDSEWSKAGEHFDQALSLDARNARAYYGMALAKANCRDAEIYINMLCSGTPRAENIELPPDKKHIQEAAEKYAIPGYLSADEIRALYNYNPSYHSTLRSQKQLNEQAKKRFESDRNLTRARQFAAGEFKTELEDLQKKLLKRLDQTVRDAEESSEKAKQQAESTYRSFLANKDKLAEGKCREAEAKREAAYQDAMRRFESASSTADYLNTKPLFVGLAPYKDSAEMAKRCDEEVARIEREAAEEAERKRKAEAEEAERQRLAVEKGERERAARKKRLTLAAVLAIVLAVAGYFTYTKIIVPANIYKRAEALYQEKRYNEAIAVFKELGDYKDSAAKIIEVKEAINTQDYAKAEALFEEGKYEEAIKAFTALDGYKDSAIRIDEVQEAINARDYAKAEALFEEGKYEEAIKAFTALDGYKDSTIRIDEVQEAINARYYAEAEALFEDGKYEEAVKAFTALGGYKDSVARTNASKEAILAGNYDAAEALYESGDRFHAALAFNSLGNFRDASDRCFELWDQVAQHETITAGGEHLVGLQADGTVVAVGWNKNGECNVSGWKSIVAIAAASSNYGMESHTVGLRADGTVVATVHTGKNDYYHGQCDISNWTNIVAVATGDCHTVGLRADGTVVATKYTGDQQFGDLILYQGQCDVSDWREIVAVTAGRYHTVGLRADGTVVATKITRIQKPGGLKLYHGQCDVSGWTEIVAVSAGWQHTVGLKANGTVVAVGDNASGQCDVSGWRNIVAIAAGGRHTVGLRADGTVIAVGDNSFGQCRVSDWTGIVAIAAGDEHTVGLKADGTVIAVGYNTSSSCSCDVSGWRNIKLPKT